MAAAPVPAAPGPDTADAYALGRNPAETARLRRQSEELRPQGLALLRRVGLAPGQSAIDLGCGQSGLLDLLSHAVAPAGGWWGWTLIRRMPPLLVTIPEPAQVVTEMARLARPGGWVASQEPDCEYSVCYPPLRGKSGGISPIRGRW